MARNTSALHPKAGTRFTFPAKAPATPRATKGSDLLGVGQATKAGAALRTRKQKIDQAIDV